MTMSDNSEQPAAPRRAGRKKRAYIGKLREFFHKYLVRPIQAALRTKTSVRTRRISGASASADITPERVGKLFRRVWVYNWAGKILVWVPVSIFLLTRLPYDEFINSANPEHIKDITLWVYYTLWFWGAPIDNAYHKNSWEVGPEVDENKELWQAIGFIAIGVLIAAVGLRYRHDDFIFSLFLAAFFVFNVVGQYYIVYMTRPIIEASREKFHQQRDSFKLARLEISDWYISGKWQTVRFVIMLLMIGVLVTASASNEIRHAISLQCHNWFNTVREDAVYKLLPTMMFVVFLLVGESVMWFARGSVWIQMRAVEWLRKDYVLEKKTLTRIER
jgi:hypothetical protein